MNINKINLIKNIIYKYFFFIFIININIDVELIFSLLRNKKIRGFLNVIALCEGTKKKLINKSIDKLPSINEYMVSFINAEKIINLQEYPNKIFCGDLRHGRACASAAGRYQFIKNTWKYLTKRIQPYKVYKNNTQLFQDYFLDIPNLYQNDVINFYKSHTDLIKYKFGPFWQDFYAIVLLLESNAIPDIINKNYKSLIKKASKIWSTLPKDKSGLSIYESEINHAKPLNYTLNMCKQYI